MRAAAAETCAGGGRGPVAASGALGGAASEVKVEVVAFERLER